MATRRPRIKPVANIQLNAKRKSKTVNDVKTIVDNSSVSQEVQELVKQDNIHAVKATTTPTIVQDNISVEKVNKVRKDSYDTPAIDGNLKNGLDQQEQYTAENVDIVEKVISVGSDNNKDENLKINEVQNVEEQAKSKRKVETELPSDCSAFKCPPNVDFQRSVSHISNSGVDDVFYSDIEENALQMDMEKPTANSYPMSPSKNLNRQRIRPTPHFGQRRNSFVSTSPSPHTTANEESNKSNYANGEFVQPSPTRRERHHSASFTGSNHSSATNHYHHHTPHKYLPSGVINSSMGRIRTESSCSVFSDTNASTYKSRKHEDSKQNLRKEFEARFFNGVPEKSVIKMSDLIYYNPVTNPMEQKSNPNVKLEQSESSLKDVKAFDGKDEKDTEEKTAEDDGVPVPQLKLNAKGELILDDKSLVIETTAEQEARKVLANSSLIYLDENTGMNGFYSRQKRTREWLPSETIKFYRCLQNVGTDFSLMVSLFPNRSRRDLKLKFKKEERRNAHLINKALLYPKQFNLEALKQQIGDEEKQREEQAKNAKNAKEKVKRSKKRKVSSSAADRVLQSDVVYQNENVEKPKRVRKAFSSERNDNQTTDIATETNTKEACKNKSNLLNQKLPQISNDSINTTVDQENQQINGDEVNINDSIIDTSANKDVPESNKGSKPKRRRRRTPNKLAQKKEIVIIKEEIVKTETKQDSNNTLESAECLDGTELQTEMDELLNTDAVESNYSSSSCDTQTLNNILEESQTPQQSLDVNHSSYSSYITQNGDNYQADMNVDKYEHHTIINLDDGSVSVYSKLEDLHVFNTTDQAQLTSPPSQTPIVPLPPDLPPEIYSDNTSTVTVPEPEILSNETCSSVICDKELNEEDIQSILTELADGSLVLVSSLDPDDPDKVLNEIYMVDQNTGDLFDEPLNIPDNIVQCILSVLS